MENKRRWEFVLQSAAVIAAAILCGVALILLTYQAHADDRVPAGFTKPSQGDIASYDELLAALRGAGAIVRPSVEFSQPFFSGRGQVAWVEDVQVLVVEYPSEQTRESEPALISADGNSVGSTDITWTDQPNFWASGRVIVLYLGHDQRMLSLLNNALGPPITAYEQTGSVRRR